MIAFISNPSKFKLTKSPASISTRSNAPTSVPTPIISNFSANRESILITIPKYLDHQNSDEKETYEISFDKVSANSGYYLTNNIFLVLVILDKNYKFSVELTKETAPNLDELENPFTKVKTNQFGTLKKYVKNTEAGSRITFKYISDFAAVNLFPQNLSRNYYAFMTCNIIGEDRGECDKIISTLSIELK